MSWLRLDHLLIIDIMSANSGCYTFQGSKEADHVRARMDNAAASLSLSRR